MRCVIQRVTSASVKVDGETVSSIHRGLCVLVGLSTEDKRESLEWMSKKLLSVRFFEGEDGKMWKRNVQEIQGEILLVSQFTLHFRLVFMRSSDRHCTDSLQGSKVRTWIFQRACRQKLLERCTKVKDGKFGAKMEVEICNDGPVCACFISHSTHRAAGHNAD
ncbi:hypothetical protein GUITHDRAFT_75286 [Guillardia theta CCMP2712]|uniref:D-aminoacyl-tRNA deacylase n=1 Tax=Guillardia theta (strain CCMP2712) TaxID=905079 RepID=L1IWZ8_GUITC|nr:hypothetical protein GUITHDRAFT_75286 [Guillardia theta CCMP2712]EKX40768.1 hypothetical protein GUITHDRAFT_75286 [Guillardia theta CCMP2712]|eukprot:XP_005827748.1 hypothetical protein GUITHDRAFT_75286 [Guillardia theta CCMP2712]